MAQSLPKPPRASAPIDDDAASAPIEAVVAEQMSPHDALTVARRVTSRQVGGGGPLTEYETCLPHLLEALAWTGETRHLVEALPHVDPIDRLEAFQAVLARLGYDTEVSPINLAACAHDRFPMICRIDGALRVVVGRAPDGALLVVDDADPMAALLLVPGGDPDAPRASRSRIEPPTRPVLACRAWPADGAAARDRSRSWFMDRFDALGDTIRGTLWLTFLINVLAVATPLFSMTIYNLVIPADAYDTLAFLVALVLVALFVEDRLRRTRVRLVSEIAIRLHTDIMREGFSKVLALPINQLEQVSTTAQLAQLKRFENVLGAFHGPAVVALLDLPFTIVLLVAIAALGGPIVLVPVALGLAFAAIAFVAAPIAERAAARAAQNRREAHEILRESVTSEKAIRAAGVEVVWLDRLASVLASEADAAAKGEISQQLKAHAAQLLLSLAAATMLAIGALMAIAGDLSVGALIAVVMLMWRVLSPIQTAFLSLGQLKDVRKDIAMIDQLMTFKDERRIGQAAQIYRRFDGAMRLEGVSFRYPQASEFSLRNVSVDVEPGERVGVMGPSGSGRSTVLRIALGLYPPSVGTAYIDGMPLRQLDGGEVRASAAFAPKRPDFFYGTIAQNMWLARPDISNREIEEMLEAFDVPLYPETFPEGLETRLTSSRRDALGPVVMQKLNLTRALLSERSMVLLDDPTAVLDDAAQETLVALLDRRRAQTATLIASNSRRVLESCDRVLLLSAGKTIAMGRPEEVLTETLEGPGETAR